MERLPDVLLHFLLTLHKLVECCQCSDLLSCRGSVYILLPYRAWPSLAPPCSAFYSLSLCAYSCSRSRAFDLTVHLSAHVAYHPFLSRLDAPHRAFLWLTSTLFPFLLLACMGVCLNCRYRFSSDAQSRLVNVLLSKIRLGEPEGNRTQTSLQSQSTLPLGYRPLQTSILTNQGLEHHKSIYHIPFIKSSTEYS